MPNGLSEAEIDEKAHAFGGCHARFLKGVAKSQFSFFFRGSTAVKGALGKSRTPLSNLACCAPER